VLKDSIHTILIQDAPLARPAEPIDERKVIAVGAVIHENE